MNRKEPVANRQSLEEIGELLFELLTADISEIQREIGWMIFERKLRQYYSETENNKPLIIEVRKSEKGGKGRETPVASNGANHEPLDESRG